MRSVYPSDISRERFEIILPDLESCRKKTKPRKLDLYELLCGVLYVLKSGCQGNVQKSVSNRIFNSTQFLTCQEKRYQVET